MATTTNFGWETPDDTDLVKDGAAAIRTALGGVDTSFVDLKGGTTGQVLAKASGTDLDFSWVAQDDSNAIQNAIVDAKGDLIAATAADTPARLAVGTNGQILTADSTASTGLAWATPAAAGGMTLISTTNVSGASSFSLTSIPGTYKELLMVWRNFYSTVGFERGYITLNNSSTASHYFVSCTSHFTPQPDNFIPRLNNGATASLVGSLDTHNSMWQQFGGSSSDTNAAGRGWLRLIDYTNTEYLQFVGNSTGQDTGGSTSYNFGGGRFDTNGSALSRIDVSFTRNVTGTVYLYGVN